MRKICILTTGGTIDKDYPKRARQYAFEIAEPAVKRIMDTASPNFVFEIISLLKKDSLDITEEDRDKIYETCRKADCDKIIITHGTDTMIETAKRLSDIRDKVIVLTGSMKPERFSDSDASFNIGTAIGAMNVLERGVYIAMNGRVYTWNRCRKLKIGKFAES